MHDGITEAAQEHKRRFENLRTSRGTWESHWREVAQYVYPEAEEFWQEANLSSQGEKKSHRIYDATPMLANQQFASLVESLTVPRHSRWHTLTVPDSVIMRDRDAQEWLEFATNQLFRYRYHPRANFQNQISESFMSIGAFGNGPFFTDKASGYTGIRYKSIFIGDFYFDVNFQGVVDTVYRRYDYSHQQAMQRWGDAAPKDVKKLVEKNPYERNSYIHVVCPNDDLTPGAPGPKGMDFKSYHIHIPSGHECETGGYRTMPYSLGRYQTSPHELYGRGPAMSVLPDIRTLNEMARADLRATHKLVDPPLLVHDDGVLGSGRQQIYLDPGMVNMGGVSPDGRPLIQPLQTGARVDLNEAKMEVKRTTIREAFLTHLFRMHHESKRMTATEAMMRNQDRGSYMGPIMGRIQSEMICPIIERELDILSHLDALPPPPEKLKDYLAEGEYDIAFESPLSRMQRAENLVGIDMLIQQGIALANVGQPEVLEALDGFEIMRLTADGAGAPVTVVRSEEQFRQRMAEKQAQAAQQAQMEAAPGAASAIKDLAQAEKLEREGL